MVDSVYTPAIQDTIHAIHSASTAQLEVLSNSITLRYAALDIAASQSFQMYDRVYWDCNKTRGRYAGVRMHGTITKITKNKIHLHTDDYGPWIISSHLIKRFTLII